MTPWINKKPQLQWAENTWIRTIIPHYKEDVPILIDDLLPKPTPENKEEDKLEGEKGEKEGLQQQNKTQDLEEDAEDTDMDVECDDFNDY